jgi:hypothetical protein
MNIIGDQNVKDDEQHVTCGYDMSVCSFRDVILPLSTEIDDYMI